ncbi:MAG TPA: tetratricopeptide repeat protein, partial [Steroidobacteraceae bacterium]|nr:tetratricopeptide repeat protein [Steroidobacteraceae bacterium]
MKRSALFLEKVRTFAVVILLFSGFVTAAAAQPITKSATLCNAPLHPSMSLGQWALDLGRDGTAAISLALPANRDLLLEAREIGVDVDLAVATAKMATLHSGNPIQHRGVVRVLLHSGDSGWATVQVRGDSDGGLGHRVTLRAYDLSRQTDACGRVSQALASGDTDYQAARRVSDGLGTSTSGSEADLYASAYREYQHGLAGLAPQNVALRAELSHTLATLSCKYMQHWQECESWSTQAVKLWELAGDAEGRADAQSLQARSWMELSQLPDAATAAEPVRRESRDLMRHALHQFRGLAEFYLKRNERLNGADQFTLIGLTLYNSGDYSAALLAYGRAQSLCEAIGARYRLAIVLQNIALVDWDLGRTSTALNTFQRAMGFVDKANSPALYVLILNNFGLANRTAGHLDKALAQHAQALDLATRIQVDAARARSLFGLGMVYSAVGERELAATFLHQALDAFGRGGEGRESVSVLHALASIAAEDGHHDEAIRLYRQALAHATEPAVRTMVLSQIAESESLVGSHQAAADDLALAARIPGAQDSISRSLVQRERGALDYRAGTLPQARASLQAALATDRAYGLDAAAFDTRVLLAQVELAAGHTVPAMQDLDAALKLSEVLRVQVSGPDLRAASMQPLRLAFDLKIELLARACRQAATDRDTQGAERAARAALAVAERSRSRVMRDISLREYTRAAAARVDPLLERKSGLLSDLAAHEDRLEADGVSSSKDPRAATMRTDVADLREQLAVVDSQLAILSRSAPDAVHDRPGTEATPPADVAIISYWLGASRAYAWLETQSDVRMIDLGAADALRAAAELDHSAYGNPRGASTEQRLHAGANLSRLVLEPVLAQMPTNITRLIIIPDGPLHYVSFAALPMRAEAEDSFLVAKYEVAYGSSIATVLNADEHRDAADGMLLVADAIYGSDDPRLVHVGRPAPLLAAERPQFRSALNTGTLQRLPPTAA